MFLKSWDHKVKKVYKVDKYIDFICEYGII